MAEHRIGTREEWQAAHQKLVERENELAERSRELAEQRRELPWVPVEMLPAVGDPRPRSCRALLSPGTFLDRRGQEL
jgi:uncharacterized protein DUF899